MLLRFLRHFETQSKLLRLKRLSFLSNQIFKDGKYCSSGYILKRSASCHYWICSCTQSLCIPQRNTPNLNNAWEMALKRQGFLAASNGISPLGFRIGRFSVRSMRLSGSQETGFNQRDTLAFVYSLPLHRETYFVFSSTLRWHSVVCEMDGNKSRHEDPDLGPLSSQSFTEEDVSSKGIVVFSGMDEPVKVRELGEDCFPYVQPSFFGKWDLNLYSVFLK